MTTIYAWFSPDAALRVGSAVYRKPDGSTVKVTRVAADRDARGRDETYVGRVVHGDEGGRVRPTSRVHGITG